MPPPKKTTRSAAKKTTKTTAKKRTASRKMTAAHKKALAEGRATSKTVDQYLVAINTPRRRGRKLSKATLEQRLVEARSRSKTASGVEKVVAAQEVRDLQTRIAQADAVNGTDLKTLESEFVRVAKAFSANRNISYGSWRDVGVSADVLRRAGVVRTRG